MTIDKRKDEQWSLSRTSDIMAARTITCKRIFSYASSNGDRKQKKTHSVKLPASKLIQLINGKVVRNGLYTRLHYLSTVLNNVDINHMLHLNGERRTLTTLDDALPCSYARSAVSTMGNCDIRDTNPPDEDGVGVEDDENDGFCKP